MLLASIPVGLHLASILLEVLGTEMSLTNQRVIVKHGYFKHAVDSMTWSKVESVSVYQSFLGRQFDYGTINIYGVGGERIYARNVSEPSKFRKQAIDMIEKAQD